MTFTTLTFIAFLGLVFAVHWAIPDRLRNGWLLAASYFFYGWWDWRFCWLMLVSSLVDYLAGLAIQGSSRRAVRRAALAAAMATNLAMLGFFKYFNFFADSAQALGQRLGWHLDRVTLDVVLPVGISFYTFQTMSYSIDVYRGDLRATRRLVDYLVYVSFFPQLVAGPIERGTRLLPQFLRPRRFDYARAAEGCRYILWGFFKKMALADNLAPIVDDRFARVAASSGPELALATVAFALQIYCDFSAYSDIAIGTAKLFGVELMRNFAYPYFSASVPEFWRRWHISLSTWFADYLYRPLGGSRVPPLRRATNVMAVFLLSGLWHGAAWHFVAWGALNGLAMMPAALWPAAVRVGAEDRPGGPGSWPAPVMVARIATTFAFTCFAWIFFRASNLTDALIVVASIVTEFAWLDGYRELLTGLEPLAAVVVVFLAIEWSARDRGLPLQLASWPMGARWTAYTGLLWLTLGMSRPAAGPFLYFQF